MTGIKTLNKKKLDSLSTQASLCLLADARASMKQAENDVHVYGQYIDKILESMKRKITPEQPIYMNNVKDSNGDVFKKCLLFSSARCHFRPNSKNPPKKDHCTLTTPTTLKREQLYINGETDLFCSGHETKIRQCIEAGEDISPLLMMTPPLPLNPSFFLPPQPSTLLGSLIPQSTDQPMDIVVSEPQSSLADYLNLMDSQGPPLLIYDMPPLQSQSPSSSKKKTTKRKRKSMLVTSPPEEVERCSF
jgi:hypothetical protein